MTKATGVGRGSTKCAAGCTCGRHVSRPCPNKTHGWRESKTYRVWSRMKERCLRPGHKSWEHYGGRGISVCDRWMHFENFLEDMGGVPDGMSIERDDVNKGYSPENCRWATTGEQSLNRTDSSLLTAFGETKNACEWARDSRCLVSAAAICHRKKKGWADETIILTPPRPWNKRSFSGREEQRDFYILHRRQVRATARAKRLEAHRQSLSDLFTTAPAIGSAAK